jgi:hypothetical protein
MSDSPLANRIPGSFIVKGAKIIPWDKYNLRVVKSKKHILYA